MKCQNAEEAIEKYQEAKNSNNFSEAEIWYEEILTHYNPINYRNVWWRKYGWLYNFETNDFNSDYIIKFIDCLNKFKSKDSKGNYRNINNYFFSAIKNMYSAMIYNINKSDNNPKIRCPACGKIIKNAYLHIKEEHNDILWEKITELGISEQSFEKGCPICPHYLPRKQCKTTDKNKILDHVLKIHSSLLFEKFKELYPGNYLECKDIINISDLTSLSEDEQDFLEFIENKNEISDMSKSVSVENFISSDKTEIEKYSEIIKDK